MPRKMKIDDNSFPRDQNMIDARLLKGKTKVLTSTKSREALEQSILRCKYRLMSTERLEDVAINKRADMSRGKRQK